jgi:3-hydroxy-3-methylglutaryl CoA synthase/uncharacterized OB-fold protein
VTQLGITSWATYLPRYRLDRGAVSKAFSMNSGKGSRTVASFDEDASTMAVEAARRTSGTPVDTVMFSTTHPPLLDKGSAATIAAVLDLPSQITAVDLGGSARSTIGCLKAAFALATPTMLLASDMRFGRPGSDDEINGSDGAAAFTFGADPLVSLVAMESVSSPVMDRWRSEGDAGSQVWDDRWTADQQVPLMLAVVERVVKTAGIAATDIASVVVSASSSKVAAQVLGKLGGGNEANVEPFGYYGAADVGIKLARVLSRASANQHILVVSGADGADAMVLRTSATFSTAAGSVDDGSGGLAVSVIDYLAWRGLVHREPPRRPDPEIPAAPAVSRSDDWKFAFTGTQCGACGARHLPPQRICMSCGTLDKMEPVLMQHERGEVRTYTIDRIAFSPSPPVVVAVIDFESGGRFRCQLADVNPDEVQVGLKVEMVYRLISVAQSGIRNYFWKARPLQSLSKGE